MAKILQFESVSFFDQTRRRSLVDINLSISKSQIVVAFGPENCGTDLLVSLATGQEHPENGTVRLTGKSLVNASEDELEQLRSRIGYVPAGFSLVNNLSVFENIALPLRYHTGMSSEAIRDVITPRLEKYELLHRAKDRPQLLGVSELLRAAYLRATIFNPEIVIFEYSMDAICPLARSRFFDLMRKDSSENGFGILILTYYPVQFFDTEFYYLMLFEGRTVFSGMGDQLMEVENPYLEQYLHNPLQGPMPTFHPDLIGEII